MLTKWPGAAAADEITQCSQRVRETSKMMEEQTETLREALQIAKELTSTSEKDTKNNKKNKRRQKTRKSVTEAELAVESTDAVHQEKSFLRLVNRKWTSIELYNFRWNLENTNEYKHLSEDEKESILTTGEFFVATGISHML